MATTPARAPKNPATTPATPKGNPVNSTDAKPAATTDAFDFSAITPTAAAELPKQRKENTKANPMLAIVKHSADNGYKPFQYGPLPTDMVKKAVNFMHRAARELEIGCSVRQVDNGDGTTTIVYQAKQEKKTRKYTNADVRAWVKTQQDAGTEFAGYDANKRIPADVFKAYRDAHNL